MCTHNRNQVRLRWGAVVCAALECMYPVCALAFAVCCVHWAQPRVHAVACRVVDQFMRLSVQPVYIQRSRASEVDPGDMGV
jgi:hypothetical protein